jgi:hypothetical protein
MARAPDPDPPLDETKAQFGTAPTRAAPDVETRALTPNPDADASLAGAGVPPTLDLVRDQETELYRASGAPGGVLSEETRSITEPIKPKGVQPGSSQRRELMGSWGTVSADGKLEPGQVVFGRYLVKQGCLARPPRHARHRPRLEDDRG